MDTVRAMDSGSFSSGIVFSVLTAFWLEHGGVRWLNSIATEPISGVFVMGSCGVPVDAPRGVSAALTNVVDRNINLHLLCNNSHKDPI